MSSQPRLTFLNHASFQIETDKSILLVDPWLQGTAFNDGWALLDSSTSNAQLISELGSSIKNIYIWYSHEHSDHFAIPFIKQLKSSGLHPSFIFHNTLDHRVASFLRKDGFAVIEPVEGERLIIDDQLSVTTWPYGPGDSLCLIEAGDWRILNLNDCEVKTPEDACRVHAWIGKKPVDVLLTQFGYAHWIGNEEDVELRRTASRECLEHIHAQDQAFRPRFIIPFASFVYFCDAENFYMNDCQNSPQSLRESPILAQAQDRIRFLKPHDSLELAGIEDTAEKLRGLSVQAERHWNSAFAQIKPIPAKESDTASIQEISKGFEEFREKISRNFMFSPQISEAIGFTKTIKILITDLNKIALLSYQKGLAFAEASGEWDVAVTSRTLGFILKHEYGFNTTIINGKLRARDQHAIGHVAMFFKPQDYLRNGFGFNHPYASAKVIFQKIAKRIIRKAAIPRRA